MIKNLMSKACLAVFLIFSFLFFSCQGLFSSISDDSGENRNSCLSGKVRLPFSNSSSRNIAPAFPSENLSYDVYACAAGGKTKAASGTVSSDGTFSIAILSDGNYIVYADISSSGQVVYKGESEILTISGGRISKNGAFTTEIGEIAAKPSQSGSGKFALFIDAAEADVKNIKAEWRKDEDGAASSSYLAQCSSFTLYMTDSNNTEKNIDSGSYLLTLYFYSDISCVNEIYRINEAAQVYDNLTTSVCSGNAPYFSDGKIKVTGQLIDGSAYVAGEKDAKSLVKNVNGENGTFYAPFSSISAALEKVQASGSSEMTIYIDGTFTLSDPLSLSAGSGKILTLCGLNGASSSVVSGGHGISLSSGTVKLKDISVRDSSDTGIYVAETAVLENVSVESCSLAGVYLNTSAGNVRLKNCEIKNNSGMGISAMSGTVSLTDCTITGNASAGVSAADLSAGGKIIIKDNGGSAKKNVYLASGKTIAVSSPLSSGSEIGVTLTDSLSAGSSKTITSGFSGTETDAKSIFSSDDDSCSVSAVSGEAAILKESVVWISSVGSDSNSGSYDSPFASFSKAFSSFSDKTSAANVVKIKDTLTPAAGLNANVAVTAVIQGAAGNSKDEKATIDLKDISNDNANASAFYTDAGQNLTFRNLKFTTSGSGYAKVYGAVFVVNGASVTIEDCDFTDIRAAGECSAIAIENGNLTLKNVSITGNAATLDPNGTRTYAVGFMKNAGNLVLAGKVIISGNTQSDGTTAGNVYLASGKTFTLDPSFSPESRISFSAEDKPASSSVVFASGYSLDGASPDTIFTNDDGYEISGNSSELVFSAAETVYSSWSELYSAVSAGTSGGGFDVSFKITDIPDFNNSAIYLSGVSTSCRLAIVPAKNLSITTEGNLISSAFFTATNISAAIGNSSYSITFGDSSVQSTVKFIDVYTDANLSIENCVFQNFKGNAALESSGTLLLKNCAFNNIQSSNIFGVVYIDGGTATIDSCAFSSAASDYDIDVRSSGKLVLKGIISDIKIHLENPAEPGVITLDKNLSLASGAGVSVKIGSYDSNAKVFAVSDDSEISETLRNNFTVYDEDGNQYTVNAAGTLSKN